MIKILPFTGALSEAFLRKCSLSDFAGHHPSPSEPDAAVSLITFSFIYKTQADRRSGPLRYPPSPGL